MDAELALQEALSRLGDGLHVDNLDPVIDRLRDVVVGTDGHTRLAAWVAESVLADLQRFWSTGPVRREDHEYVSAELLPALTDLLDALARSASSDDLDVLMSALVTRFIDVQVAGRTA